MGNCHMQGLKLREIQTHFAENLKTKSFVSWQLWNTFFYKSGISDFTEDPLMRLVEKKILYVKRPAHKVGGPKVPTRLGSSPLGFLLGKL